MCNLIPWYSNASEEGNPKKVIANTKKTQVPEKKEEWRDESQLDSKTKLEGHTILY